MHNLNIPGYKSKEELDTYARLLLALKPKSVAELGSCCGRLTYTLASVMQKMGGHVYAIDMWGPENMAGIGHSLENAWNNTQSLEQFNYELKDFDNIITLQGNADSNKTWNSISVELIIQDIDLGFGNTDITNVLPMAWQHLLPGGWFIGSHYWPTRTDMHDQITTFAKTVNKDVTIINNATCIWGIEK